MEINLNAIQKNMPLLCYEGQSEPINRTVTEQLLIAVRLSLSLKP